MLIFGHVGLKFVFRLVVFLFGPKFQNWLGIVPNCIPDLKIWTIMDPLGAMMMMMVMVMMVMIFYLQSPCRRSLQLMRCDRDDGSRIFFS